MPQNATHNSTGPLPSSPVPQLPPQQDQRPPHGHNNGFRSEISSGGIIYRRRNGRVEIFFIKDPYQRWTFPKGHQELGESLAETAVREIREETGLDRLRLIAPIGRTKFRFRRDGVVVEKSVMFYLFEARPDAKEKMTGEGAIWEAVWVRAHQSFAKSGYRNLDRLLSKALRLITEQERRRGLVG